jgi:hypothetical protein
MCIKHCSNGVVYQNVAHQGKSTKHRIKQSYVHPVQRGDTRAKRGTPRMACTTLCMAHQALRGVSSKAWRIKRVVTKQNVAHGALQGASSTTWCKST